MIDDDGDDIDIHFHLWGARHDSNIWTCITPWCNATIDMSDDSVEDKSKKTAKDIFKDEY